MTLISHFPLPSMPFQTHENIVFEKADKDGDWMEIEKFENRSHFKKVVTKVDNDSEISGLFNKFCSIINIRKNPVITKEFVKKI